MKREFGKALSKALVSDEGIRNFVRNKALIMMNGDYDILYALIKNEKLTSGKSFRQSLLGYFDDPNDLAVIESNSPLLTIFVPSLPENSFSAERWNTETEIPYVAIRLSTTNDVPLISPEGEEYLLDSDMIPSYPVIVIKDNERLISEKQEGFMDTKSTRILTSIDGINYKFADDIFDKELQLKNNANNQRVIPYNELDQKLIDAYNIYLSADGWQRDYIYYNIAPSNPNGQFTYSFMEHIRSFRIVPTNARPIYDKMALLASGDPTIKTGKENYGWTDGFFEIRANILIQAKNGIGQAIPAQFVMTGPELFNVTYVTNKKGVWPFRATYYNIGSVTANPISTNMPIVNWT